jgi:hypothetical protein
MAAGWLTGWARATFGDGVGLLAEIHDERQHDDEGEAHFHQKGH